MLAKLALFLALTGGCAVDDLTDHTRPLAANPIGVNILLTSHVNEDILAELGHYGRVSSVLAEINAVTLVAARSDLAAIQALPFVAAANADVELAGAPIDTVEPASFADGMSLWNTDAINVTDAGARVQPLDGTGVYIAVIDSGLVDTWRRYFPEQRIASEYARAFTGGGGELGGGSIGEVASAMNMWEHDQNGHGMAVTSAILGFQFRPGVFFNGAAPGASVIPVKVSRQHESRGGGGAWTSVVSHGIVYVANLKAGPLAAHPVIINLSLGSPWPDAMELAAIRYAISKGVVVFAAAGNYGTRGMIWPAAYPEVISVASVGWTQFAWQQWYASDVPDPAAAEDFYVAASSSRPLAGQELDIAAPGALIVSPYQFDSGNTPTFVIWGGTSFASPQTAGIAALMLQKNPALTSVEIESILESTALPLPAGCRAVRDVAAPVCWTAEAAGAGLVTADAALAATP